MFQTCTDQYSIGITRSLPEVEVIAHYQWKYITRWMRALAVCDTHQTSFSIKIVFPVVRIPIRDHLTCMTIFCITIGRYLYIEMTPDFVLFSIKSWNKWLIFCRKKIKRIFVTENFHILIQISVCRPNMPFELCGSSTFHFSFQDYVWWSTIFCSPTWLMIRGERVSYSLRREKGQISMSVSFE